MPSIDRFYYFLGRVVSSSFGSENTDRLSLPGVQDVSIPVKPFPKGLRIFAGDPFNKAPIANRAAEFICQIRPDFTRSLVGLVSQTRWLS